MHASVDATIATTLRAFLEKQLRASSARSFFRLEGFREATYSAFLQQLKNSAYQLADRTLTVRSIGPIAHFPELAMEADRSATWYRNTVPADQALVLILNRRTSDAQSLKDVFAVDEQMLTRDGLELLIEACFTDYDLSRDQQRLLVDFIKRLRRLRLEPQLRDLAECFRELNRELRTSPGTSLAEAIAHSLPFLNLFRCEALAAQLNTPRGDKLLRMLKQAVQWGGEVHEENERKACLDRLATAQIADDSVFGGFDEQTKRDLLRRFIEGALDEQHPDFRELLKIDWSEVQQVLSSRGQRSKVERYETLADELKRALTNAELSVDAEDVLTDLQQGREPESNDVEVLLDEVDDLLPRSLRLKVQKLVRPREYRNADFLVGVVAAVIDLVHARQAELSNQARIEVQPNRQTLELIEKNKSSDALDAFWAIYGGIERVFPAIDWRLAEMQRQPLEDEAANDVPESNERQRKQELGFRITLRDGTSEVAHADLIWQYRLDSPISATVLALAAEQGLLQAETTALRIPIYSSVTPLDEINDLDLRLPLASLGPWYAKPTDLRDMLTPLRSTVRPAAWAGFAPAFHELERQWAAFVRQSADGLISADTEPLLQAYEQFFASALSHLTTGNEATMSFRHLNQAWMICPPTEGKWVIMPMLHPLKLLWWRERTRYLDTFVQQLLGPTPVTIVDAKRFQQSLAATYGSSNFPPVVALATQQAESAKLYVALEEAEGYELFVLPKHEAEAFGLDTDLLTDEENRLAAQRAVEGIVGVVQDYIETYPFVRDGIEILLFECRNGAIPGLLVEQLSQASSKRNWQLSLNIVVHTSERGAPLFRRVSKWIAGEHAGTERKGLAFFPSITVKVLECPLEKLFPQSSGIKTEDTDIAILADVLASYAQTITPKLVPAEESDAPLLGYLPTFRARQEPFQKGERERRLLLNAPQPPRLVRLFQLSQYAAWERHTPPLDHEARFYRDLRLEDEPSRIIEQLHKRFNWVICYDTTIDRFLLEATFPQQVQVIRYSLGLGPKRQHNLTVSSSGHSRRIVEQRVASRLARLFPQAPAPFRMQVAKQLVNEANAISGDIVLRAAGPGTFLNELIGVVLAKFETERRFKAQHPNALCTWIMLDDFKHWFNGGKFPDLLFVAIEQGDVPTIAMQVLEAKCVGEESFEGEASDAERQVWQGVARLRDVFAPGNQHLDALLWYDHLYRAVVGNLEVPPELRSTWEAFRDSLHEGAFKLALQGHTWVFCYDHRQETPTEHSFVGPDPTPEIALTAHHYGRNTLAQLLKTLIEGRGEQIDLPSAWDALNSAPIPQPAPTPPPISATERQTIHPASNGTAATTTTITPPAIGGEGVTDQPPAVIQPVLHAGVDDEWLTTKARELERVLRQRGVLVQPIDPTQADIGPSIVRFKVRLRPNEVLRKIQGVAEDLARDLALASAPLIDNVARTNFVGIDIPRPRAEIIELEPLLAQLGTPQIGELPIIVGVAPDGSLCIEDLSEFPHLLVAGATNSGKSVFLRSILLSLMSQYRPSQLELLIIDPKQTDFTFFNSLPYLRGGKVITAGAEARDSLLQLVREEMPRRQQLIANRSIKVKNFNQRFPDEAVPPIVALIDEYALLVSMMNKKERESFEQDLMILASAARSVSIHLVVATQRPSADVVTSTLKANLDARIAFKVASNINSRVVLDTNGAENLLGRGDLLFRGSGGELARFQAPYMAEDAMIAFLARFKKPV